MTSTSLTNIAAQDDLEGTLSTPFGTENIPPVRPTPVDAPTQTRINAATLHHATANQQSQKIIPTWVYFSFASAAVLSVVYWIQYA